MSKVISTSIVSSRNLSLANMFFRHFVTCLLLFYISSCAPTKLIEDAKLNETRFHDTVSRASDASGLRATHPLSVKLVKRAELQEIFQDGATTSNQSESHASRLAGYRAMGFLAGDWQDAHSDVTLRSRAAGGFYIPTKRTLYFIGEPARSENGSVYLSSLGEIGDELTLAHEIIHALQHQHYPEVFEPKESLWQQQADAGIALQAAVEGDATYWAARSIRLLGRARDPEEVIEFSRDSKFSPLADVNALVRERMQFPYTYGYRFAYHEGKNGLKSPPASTEQVIHIATKGKSAFAAIDLADIPRIFESIGCRILFQDTMGELTLSLWFRNLAPGTDQRAWEGWDGDRWIAADCENSPEVAWLTSWDTEQDAVEFESAIRMIAPDWERRGNLKAPLMAERQGREVMIISGGLWPARGQFKQLARYARVTTRAELAAHFASTNSKQSQ